MTASYPSGIGFATFSNMANLEASSSAAKNNSHLSAAPISAKINSTQTTPSRMGHPMSDRPFVHLHCHTHYSLLDGASRVPELVQLAKSLGMNAIAMTDHGNLFGAIEFYKECKDAGLNPVVGYEAYVAPTS